MNNQILNIMMMLMMMMNLSVGPDIKTISIWYEYEHDVHMNV